MNTEKMKKSSQLREIFGRLLRNKTAMVGLFILLVLVICAVFAPWIAPYDYAKQDLTNMFDPPSLAHPFGTDNVGRDILSRVIYGARISLVVGVCSVCLAATLGIILGAAPGYARIVRASILSLKDQEFVEAARSVGASDFRIIFSHILPNCLAPIIVQMTLGVASAILSTASLSFIGLGIAPPTPEWGSMLSTGRQYIRDAWYVVTFPGVAIMLSIFGLNLFGDGLRDALDPKLKN